MTEETLETIILGHIAKELKDEIQIGRQVSLTKTIMQSLRIHDIKALSIADIIGMLSDQMKRHIDLAYLTGVFNVSGIDGLQKELTRLKEISKNPHDIFSEGNDR